MSSAIFRHYLAVGLQNFYEKYHGLSPGVGVGVGVILVGSLVVLSSSSERILNTAARMCVWGVYNVVYLHSLLEIHLFRGVSNTMKRVLWKDNESTIEFVKAGILQPRGVTVDLSKGFCIYTDTSTQNKKLYYGGTQELSGPPFELSTVRFLLVEALTTDNKRIKIDLQQTGQWNYYVKDNVLTLDFYRYFLHEILAEHDAAETLKTVCYMDPSNFQMVEADEIRLLSDTFEKVM